MRVTNVYVQDAAVLLLLLHAARHVCAHWPIGFRRTLQESPWLLDAAAKVVGPLLGHGLWGWACKALLRSWQRSRVVPHRSARLAAAACMQTLYESAVAFGIRKALQTEQGKSEMEGRITTLESDVKDLERQVWGSQGGHGNAWKCNSRYGHGMQPYAAILGACLVLREGWAHAGNSNLVTVKG
jgi:hypothetical protein